MAMLSLLQNFRIPVFWKGDNSQPATPQSVPYGAVATINDANTESVFQHVVEKAVLLWNSNGTFGCVSDCRLTVNVNISVQNMTVPETAVRVYRLSMMLGNPSAEWDAIIAGNPKAKPYPNRTEFNLIRSNFYFL